jgi:hypothetical protein
MNKLFGWKITITKARGHGNVDRKIHSFWTHDGSVLVKETERSRPLVVKSRQDIYRLGGEILNGDEED